MLTQDGLDAPYVPVTLPCAGRLCRVSYSLFRSRFCLDLFVLFLRSLYREYLLCSLAQVGSHYFADSRCFNLTFFGLLVSASKRFASSVT
jgi:hypothetical protein